MQPASIDLRATVAAQPWKTVAFAFGRAVFSALREAAARRVAIYARPWLDEPSRPHARHDPNS